MGRNSLILIVDDDLEDQMMLQEYFDGIEPSPMVKYLDNGRLALDYLEECHAENLPALIVLDLNMPIMNGTQTLLQIKKASALKSIPVVIFSTSDNEEEKRKCMSFGAEEYLKKPISWEEGMAVVKRFVTYLLAR